MSESTQSSDTITNVAVARFIAYHEACHADMVMRVTKWLAELPEIDVPFLPPLPVFGVMPPMNFWPGMPDAPPRAVLFTCAEDEEGVGGHGRSQQYKSSTWARRRVYLGPATTTTLGRPVIHSLQTAPSVLVTPTGRLAGFVQSDVVLCQYMRNNFWKAPVYTPVAYYAPQSYTASYTARTAAALPAAATTQGSQPHTGGLNPLQPEFVPSRSLGPPGWVGSWLPAASTVAPASSSVGEP